MNCRSEELLEPLSYVLVVAKQFMELMPKELPMPDAVHFTDYDTVTLHWSYKFLIHIRSDGEKWYEGMGSCRGKGDDDSRLHELIKHYDEIEYVEGDEKYGVG